MVVGYGKSRSHDRTDYRTALCAVDSSGVCATAQPTMTAKIKFSLLYKRRNGFHALQRQCINYRCQNNNVSEDYDRTPFDTREQYLVSALSAQCTQSPQPKFDCTHHGR